MWISECNSMCLHHAHNPCLGTFDVTLFQGESLSNRRKSLNFQTLSWMPRADGNLPVPTAQQEDPKKSEKSQFRVQKSENPCERKNADLNR